MANISLLLLLIVLSSSPSAGQQKADLKPRQIIDIFLEKTGGENWHELSSRKESSAVTFEEDHYKVVPTKSYDRIKINFQSIETVEVHNFPSGRQTVLAYKPDCNWYYSSTSQVIKFFGPEPIKFQTTYPRTELMEILNLEPKNLAIEDTLYRIDFKDARQLDGIQSLFFGKNSGFLHKRGYTSKNGVQWEYQFSHYQGSQGFTEPYLIELFSNGNRYFAIEIQSIHYNVEIDPSVFEPPAPCENQDSFQALDIPYVFPLN